MNLHIHEIFLREQKTLKWFFIPISDIKKFLAFCPFFFSWVFETAIYLSIGSLWWKNFSRTKHDFSIFSNIERRVSVFLLKLFWRVVKTALHLSIGTLWWKLIFLRKRRKVFKLFRHWAKIFWPAVDIFSAGCQIWILRVHTEPFKEEKFFWKNMGKLTFRIMSKSFNAFFRKKNSLGL